MIAKNDSSISEFAHKIYEMSEDDRVWEQCLAREMYDHDRASAIAAGIEQGIQQGITQINELHRLLIQAKRLEDLERSTLDPAYQMQLLKEFGLL